MLIAGEREEARRSDEKVHTRHPLGKRGQSIRRKDHELFAQAIVAALREEELTHTELVARLERSSKRRFSGNVSWYTMTVKLDLEARGVIGRTASKPQRYLLK